MNFNLIAGAAATAALFAPVLLIVAGRLWANRSLLVLGLYYLLTGVYNLMDLGVIPAAPLLERSAGIVFNYLDAPLMLVVFLFFCNEAWKRKLVLWVLLLFTLFEIIIAFWLRLSVQSSVYVLGPGTLVILGLAILFFTHYGKITIVQGKGQGKTFMLVSIMFSYASFLILYYLHYLVHTPAKADVFLIYYIGVFISATIMSIGLVWIIRRTREIEERQQTRKELALFFEK